MEEEILLEVEDNCEKAVLNLQERFKTVRTGRANPSSLDKVMVVYYGVPTPLRQLANITVPEARQLLIKPFDKSCLSAIEKGIYEADLGYTPNNDGETIRIVIPDLTEDRRKELVKQVKAMMEESKVSIRNARRDGLDMVEKGDFPEDTEKHLEDEIQKLVDKYNKKAEEELEIKEKDLMSV
jgi:ribosome recycling factor